MSLMKCARIPFNTPFLLKKEEEKNVTTSSLGRRNLSQVIRIYFFIQNLNVLKENSLLIGWGHIKKILFL
jgi:hypothetical protein